MWETGKPNNKPAIGGWFVHGIEWILHDPSGFDWKLASFFFRVGWEKSLWFVGPFLPHCCPIPTWIWSMESVLSMFDWKFATPNKNRRLNQHVHHFNIKMAHHFRPKNIRHIRKSRGPPALVEWVWVAIAWPKCASTRYWARGSEGGQEPGSMELNSPPKFTCTRGIKSMCPNEGYDQNFTSMTYSNAI